MEYDVRLHTQKEVRDQIRELGASLRTDIGDLRQLLKGGEIAVDTAGTRPRLQELEDVVHTPEAQRQLPPVKDPQGESRRRALARASRRAVRRENGVKSQGCEGHEHSKKSED